MSVIGNVLSISQHQPLAYLGLTMSLLVGSVNAQTLDLSDLPLDVQTDVPPNIVVSLDDSGSMGWGFMPDATSSRWWSTVYRSSTYNRIYYDPSVPYDPPKTSTGASENNASYTAAIRGFYYDTGNQFTVDLSQSFRPIYYHYSAGGSIFLGDNAVTSYGCRDTVCADEPAFYFNFHGSATVNAACDGLDENNGNSVIPLDEDEGCYTKVVIDTDDYSGAGGTNANGRTLAEEQTNFANWYQYYSIRADANKSAIRIAFVPDNVENTVRIGRQAFNQDRFIGSGTENEDNSTIAEFDDTERQGFYSWVGSVGTSGGTPLRNAVVRAGEYFKTDNAYYENPESGTGDLLGCRANAHLLVTDGFYNGGFTQPTGFLLDQNGTTLPDADAPDYVPGDTPIFPNALDSQSIADLTFHYWATDLRSGNTQDADHKVNESPDTQALDYFDPRRNPATWQHMQSFAVAFGAQGTVPTDEATYQELLAGTYTNANNGNGWPQSVADQPTAIDDLYHSGVNGRGGFFSATNPAELVQALVEVTEGFPKGGENADAVGTPSGRISSGDNIYIAAFDPDSWSGDLEAFAVSDGSGDTACDEKPLGMRCSEDPVWSAYDRNEEGDIVPGDRVIFSYDPTQAVGSRGIEFLWSSLNAVQQTSLNQSDSLGEERLNYIRGDSSNEQDQGGSFRTRQPAEDKDNPTLVGAIVHSNPSYVGPAGTIEVDGKTVNNLAFRFPNDLESQPYAIAGRDEVVYVGANDGMLHAYSAGTGEELFAYVPNEVIDNLYKFTDPRESYEAYVDGLIDVQDAFVNGAWRTLLASGLRSGGQGFFLLDITRPGSLDDVNSIVKWEFTDENDPDMGYTYGDPVIVKSNYNGGEWVVLLPNGYNSNENDGASTTGVGDAVLYVVSAEDGELIAKIPVEEFDTPNGLSSVVAVSDFDVQNFDDGKNGTDIDVWIADYAYAGDLHGNFWKFDLSSTNENEWKVIKMFDAGDDQPITAKPAVGSFPRRGTDEDNQDYRFVYFGTGQYLEPDDIKTTPGQTFYAFIDNDTCPSGVSACISSGELVEQTINTVTGVLSSNSVTELSKGCKLDLSAGDGASERVVSGAAVVAGSVFFGTLTPSGDACVPGAKGALYALNRFTCGATAAPVLDRNDDNIIDKDDRRDGEVVSRKEIDPGLVTLVTGDKDQLAIISPSSVEQLESGDRTGRVRWRQIK